MYGRVEIGLNKQNGQAIGKTEIEWLKLNGKKLKKKDVNNDLSDFMSVFPTKQS